MKEYLLYKKIPASKCKDNCLKCCTNMIQFTREEEKNMGGYAFIDGKCSHLINNRCSIYEKRPFVCRIYGTSEGFHCDNCIPDWFLTEEETTALVHEYISLKRQQEEK